jgi:uncharacterized cupredoxin-like copper-binding protein
MLARLGALPVVAMLVFGVAGCGGDESESPDAGGSASVEVVATDLHLSSKTYEASAGTVAIEYRNEGDVEHTLVIDGVDDFKLDVPGHGDVDDGTVRLTAGSYTIYCDIPGHRAAGMEATLEVS